jgi:peptidoglycan/LPS O-acetylase OafA/YrhL
LPIKVEVKFIKWIISEDNLNFEFNVILLRFLAIVSVVAYHLNPKFLPYGYIGVDIFFVISGYLILSKNLLKSEVNNFFTLNFYISRLKRIIPATYFLLLCVTLASWFLLINVDFLNFSHSLKSAILFRANYYFSQNGGYFGVSDALKPLLHLWSLGIEAQFYLIFPIFLIILRKFSDRSRIYVVILIGISSFFYNLYFQNIKNQVEFFSFTFRFWEFCIGMMVAVLPKFKGLINYKLLGLLQLFCIIIIFLNFIFPFNYLPTPFFALISSGILIWSSKDVIPINFSHIRFIVIFIARISFSLYLLHWPIIVFINYYFPDGVPVIFHLLYIPFLILSSYIYFIFFENSVINKDNLKFFIFFLIMFLFLFFISHMLIKNNGFPGRFSSRINSISNAANSNFKCPDANSFALAASKRACFIGDLSQQYATVALLGNSHAQMYAEQVSSVLKIQGKKGLLLPLDGCLPFIDFNLTGDCLLWANANLDFILRDPNISSVVVGSTWYSDSLIDQYGQNFNDADFLRRKASISTLSSKLDERGKKFYLIGPIQIPFVDYASSMSRRLAFHEGEAIINVSRSNFENKFLDLINFSKALLGSNFLLAHDYLCDANDCFFSSSEEVYFADSNHLSADGASRMFPLFNSINF